MEGGYWLTREIFLRALSAVYLVAFLALSQQVIPLIGRNGLLPVSPLMESSEGAHISRLSLPSIFWLGSSDGVLLSAAYLGLALAVLALSGISNGFIFAALWILYLSYVNIGQVFFGYGWESLLLETGFAAIFLAPAFSLNRFRVDSPPPAVLFYFLRWTLFRLMFGAGMIKLRGDTCWHDFSCLLFHYETQPLPNPLSWYFHHLPPLIHTLGVIFNHFVELIVPWMFFLPREWRAAGGVATLIFQLLLILSGNLAWLNYLTIILCLSCFDDAHLQRLVPKKLLQRIPVHEKTHTSRARFACLYLVSALLCALSINPLLNMFSSSQVMNASFEPFHLVNTYGAFGSVGKERDEIIIEGTDELEITDKTVWREFEFHCKPGDVDRRPCVVSPYHYRLDWQLWFAAMSSFDKNPWFIHLIAKLLSGDKDVSGLLAKNPFSEKPPHFIRAMLYRYEFTKSSDSSWWTRRYLKVYFPPLTYDDPRLQSYLQIQDWNRDKIPNQQMQ